MDPCMRLNFTLSSIIQRNIKSGNFKSNPLIVRDGRVEGLLNEVNVKTYDTLYVSEGNKSIVNSNSNYFINLYGERANDGIVFYRTKDYEKEYGVRMICLVDSKEVSLKYFKKIQRKNKTRISYLLTGIYLENNEKVNIININQIL